MKNKKIIGITMHGSPNAAEHGKVSGLLLHQYNYINVLKESRYSVIEFYFKWQKNTEPYLEQISESVYCFVFDPKYRPFYLEKEASRLSLPYNSKSNRLLELMAQTFVNVRLDVLHIITWMETGMMLWDAALRWGGKVVFTPTEHGAVCHYGFLLNPSGTSCNGPEGGAKCSRCTHAIEPFPPPYAFNKRWYSPRHKMFHFLTCWLPYNMRIKALNLLCEKFQYPGTGLSENEAIARVSSSAEFLKNIEIVAFQSPHQHKLFEHHLSVNLPVALPLVILHNRNIQYDKFKDKRIFTIATGPVKFVFAARSNFDRGIMFLLETWAEWKPSPTDAILIIRTNCSGRWLTNFVESLNKSGCVIDLKYGPLSDRDTEELYREGHFVINPAVWEEPLSGTVLEGLKLGTPAIVPTQTGSADFMVHGNNGYLYEFRNKLSLVKCLQLAVARKHDWEILHNGSLESAKRYEQMSHEYIKTIYNF